MHLHAGHAVVMTKVCVHAGSIPSDWYSASSLTSMYLNGNQFTGTIPATSAIGETFATTLLIGLTDAIVMKRMSLASNKLTGTVPAGLWRFRMQASCLVIKTFDS